MKLDEEMLSIAYAYLDEIEAYFAGTLSEDRLTAMLVGMANDGIAWGLTGPLSCEFTRRIEDGRIQGVIQNAWDDLNECVIEACYEKSYFARADAELIRSSQKQEVG